MKTFFRYILSGAVLLGVLSATAQQQPQFTQFTDTQLFFNPANVGTQNNFTARLFGRWQWVGFDGGPVTYAMGLEYGLPDKNIGLGFSVLNDESAEFRNTTVQLYSAYKLKVTKTGVLSMGLSGAINNLAQDLTDVFLEEEESLFATNLSQTNLNFGVGLHYDAEKWWVGASIPYVLNSVFEENSIRFFEQRRHFYLQGGYRYQLNSKVSLNPSVLFQLVSGNVPSWNGNIMAWYDNRFAGGIGWRNGESMNFIVQANLVNGVKVGYAYDLVVDQDLSQLANSSHEVGIVISPSWFKAKDGDGDGVNDKKDECPNTYGPESNGGCPLPDTDGDGVIDANDKCPNIRGLEALGGCPDSDGDGLIDGEDNCPNTAGSQENGGCPDSDGDGILDKDDSCPNVAGLSGFAGCPDTDGDGVEDSKDACPTEAGLIENEGCPGVSEEAKAVLAKALKGVQFESSRDVLKSDSYEVLAEVTKVMIDNPRYRLKISGYTDSSGNDEANLRLSKLRAAKVKDYLVENGISADRISSEGYGEANPIASNDTREGRAKNRRVEFEIE